jgi:proteasome lid subunit RPN8/RPN11
MILSNFNEKIIEHANSNKQEEVCGFVILEQDLSISVEPARNENPDPANSFSISPLKLINYKLNKNILGIYHSHTKQSEFPSAQDKKNSEESGIPYLIYSLKTQRFFLYYPESYRADTLLGRPYVTGFYECTCILKDYFINKLNINITKWNFNYWLPKNDSDANKLLITILDNNLIKVEDNKIQCHDVIVFELRKNKRLHVGIYSDNDYFIHQPVYGLSCEQIFDNRWQSKVKYVYRHHSLV